jgi:hypothetical protein
MAEIRNAGPEKSSEIIQNVVVGDESASTSAKESARHFKEHLDAKVASRRARRSIPSVHKQEMLRFFNRMGEAFESVKLITKYPPIEKDDALYEVKTDQGLHRVIRSRDGRYTMFG